MDWKKTGRKTYEVHYGKLICERQNLEEKMTVITEGGKPQEGVKPRTTRPCSSYTGVTNAYRIFVWKFFFDNRHLKD
jgi:hypothetical protein